MTKIKRQLVLGRAAEDDMTNIATWTTQNFGEQQAIAYVDAILDVFDELAANPRHARSRDRDEISPGLRTLHMSKPGRRGRHFILYRTDDATLTIIRILHDSMELQRHMPEE